MSDFQYSKYPAVAARQASERADVDALLALLNSTDRSARISAVVHLGEVSTPSAVAALVQCLQAKDEMLRKGALVSLASIGDVSVASDVYDLATQDSSVGVRVTAMSTLASLGDPRATPLIAAMLHEADPSARWYRKWATMKLVELGEKSAIPDLERARSQTGPRPIVRWRLNRAIRTLKRR